MNNNDKDTHSPKEELNNQSSLLRSSIRAMYQVQSKIPPLIEDMEGMKEYDMEDYYVRLKTILKESDESNQVAYDEVAGEKISIEVNEVFDKIKDKAEVTKILILGGAGVGKSTLMQYMAYKWSTDFIWKNKFDAVYRVTLKTLLNASWKAKYLEDKQYAHEIDKAPLKYIIHYNIARTASEGSPASKLTPQQIFLNSKTLLLLDGYDEVAHMDDQFYKTLETEIFSQKNLILTSRPNAIAPSFKGKFERIIENIGLDSDGIDLYIKLYFQENEHETNQKSQALDEFLQVNVTIKNICNIPVNIAMLCYIFQQSGDIENFQISNVSKLYEQVVQKLGERYMSKEYKGTASEGQSLKNKIDAKLKHLPEIKAIKHVAYCGMTGGGVEIEDEIRKESLIIKSYKDPKDENSTSIQKSIDQLNLKTNISRIVKYGLLKQEGTNQANTDYTFIHLSFQEYLTAQYLVEKLLFGSESEKINVLSYIGTHRNEPRLLFTLKFMAGIITNQNNEEVLKDFWNVVICNVDKVLEFSIESKVRLLMNLLGQAKREGVLDKRIPNLEEVVQLIDIVVINNISSFKVTLKDSDYMSKNIENLILAYVLESSDKSSQILKEIKSLQSESKEQGEPLHRVLDYFIDQRKQNNLIENNLRLKVFGLELISFIPHKFDQDMISSHIFKILNDEETEWINKKTTLVIFNSISSILKGEVMNILKQRVLEYILSTKIPDLYVIFLETLKYQQISQLIKIPNFKERIFKFLEEILINPTSYAALDLIPDFIKYISSNNPTEAKEIQQMFLIMSKKVINSLQKHFTKSNKETYFSEEWHSIQKLLESIDNNERFEIAKSLIQFLLDNLKDESGDIRFNLGYGFVEIILSMNDTERQIVTKNLVENLEKMINDSNIELKRFSSFFISGIIRFMENSERELKAKSFILFLLQFEGQTNRVIQSSIDSISSVFEYVGKKEETLLAKDIISCIGKIMLVDNNGGGDDYLYRKQAFWCIGNIMLQAKQVDSVQLIENALHLFLPFIGDDQNNDKEKKYFAIKVIKQMLMRINQSQRLLLLQDMIKSQKIKLLNNNNLEIQKNAFIFIQKIINCTQNLERFLLTKEEVISLQKLFEVGSDHIKEFSCESIRILFENIELTERELMAKDLFQYFERMANNETLKYYSLQTIPSILKSYNHLDRSLIAKNYLKQFEGMLSQSYESGQIAEIASNTVLLIKIINSDNLEKSQISNILSLLKKLINKEDLFALDSIFEILEYNSDLQKSFLEDKKNLKSGIQKQFSLFNKREISEFSKPIIKFLETMQEECFEQHGREKYVKICDLLEKLLSFVDNEESQFNEVLKLLEKMLHDKDKQVKNEVCDSILKAIKNADKIEKLLLAKKLFQILQKIRIVEKSVDLELDWEFRAVILIFDAYFNTDDRLNLCSEILDYMFQNKQRIIAERINCNFIGLLGGIKYFYQKIDMFETLTLDNNQISIKKIKEDSFMNEIEQQELWTKESEIFINNLEKVINHLRHASNKNQLNKYLLEMKFLFQKQINVHFQKIFGIYSYQMIHILLAIIGFESEDISDRKELIKLSKVILGYILKNLDQSGIDWILTHLYGLSELSNYSKVVVQKVCSIILEDGIIQNNESIGGINEYKVLANIIKSGGNISFNDKGVIVVDGKRYNLQFDDNELISLDKEMSQMIRKHKNPYIRQFSENNPLFKNSSKQLVANVDKIDHTIADHEWSYSKWDSVIDSKWKLVELEKYSGGKIIFFEKKDMFGKRIVLKIEECAETTTDSSFKVIKVFNSDRKKIFGEYAGPKMFYAQLNKHDSWEVNIEDSDFISCYLNKGKLAELIISEKQVLFHDGLLCMGVTADRMQDVVFFEFTKTIKDSEEELKFSLRKMSLEKHEKAFIDYYGAFLKTFSLCYTEAQVIASGKFKFDASNDAVSLLSKLASMLPMIGDITSSVISSVGEFLVSIQIKRNANSFLQFAYDHSHLSKKVGQLAKQIIIRKGKEIAMNKFERGYIDLFNSSEIGSSYKINPSKQNNKLEEISNKLLKIKSKIQAKIYSELYVNSEAKLGNEDASKFIEMITNNGLSNEQIKPTKKNENLEKMFKDIGFQNNEEYKKENKNIERGQDSSCCNVFIMNSVQYDNPHLNMNSQSIKCFLKLLNMNYLQLLNSHNELSSQLESGLNQIK